MNAFIALSPEERRRACLAAGEAIGLNAFSIEKDYWVCWTLRELFSLAEVGSHLTFKGGTSLSKGWKLIERFSEDIDVVIDRDVLGFDGERSPEAASGSNERRRRLQALRSTCQAYIGDHLGPALDRRLRACLADTDAWSLSDDPNDPDGQTLIFRYPAAVEGQGYLRPDVKIELGARSDIEPSARPEIQPYIAEVLPGLTGPSAFVVRTLDPRRTFLEKACLLHEETNRSAAQAPAARLSRHYYDLWCLIRAGISTAALADPGLFDRVVAHRAVFFRRSAAAQACLRRGTLRLMPTRDHYAAWQRDYDAMREVMFFGETPEFIEILGVIEEFQNEFNRA